MKSTPLTDRHAFIILAALTIVCFVPFLDKAFHIDEPLFLWTAEQILRNPLDFYGFTVNWEGFAKPMASVTQNPPLAAYYLALLATLFGWSEFFLHAGFLFTGFAAIWGTYRLARDMSHDPSHGLVAALTMFCTPAFLVSANSVMCDMMMVAAWVWAIVWWRRALKRDDWRLFILSGAAIAVAALTKYFGIALIPLLLTYSLAERRRPGLWFFIFLVPLVLLGAYQLYTIRMYGHGLVTNAASYAASLNLRGGLIPKTLTGLVFTGGCLASTLFSLPYVAGRRGMIILLSGILVLFGTLLGTEGDIYFTSVPHVSPGYFAHVAVMAAGGGLIIVLAVLQAWKCRSADAALLFFWILGSFIFVSYLNWTVSARNILPMAPAAGLVLAQSIRRTDRFRTATVLGRWALLSMAPALILSLLVARADYMHAFTARKAAGEIGQALPEMSGKAWFRGHWGFQYYMERLGMKPFDKYVSKVGTGDFIVVPDNNSNNEPLPVKRVTLKNQYAYNVVCCLSTMNLESGAGFYSHFWGNLPFLFGTAPKEGYQIFQVR